MANFFSYVCNGKNIKELFASTVNGITASVRCVSSMMVVINGKFASLFAAHANKNVGENRKSPATVPWGLLAEAVLTVHARNESIIYFPAIYALIEI